MCVCIYKDIIRILYIIYIGPGTRRTKTIPSTQRSLQSRQWSWSTSSALLEQSHPTMPRFAHLVPHFEALCSMKSRLFALLEENRNKPRSGGCPNDQLLAEKRLRIVHFKFFRTLGSPSAFRIFKFEDRPLVSNATGPTGKIQLGLIAWKLERLVGGTCMICWLYAAWSCALAVLDNQHPINL